MTNLNGLTTEATGDVARFGGADMDATFAIPAGSTWFNDVVSGSEIFREPIEQNDFSFVFGGQE